MYRFASVQLVLVALTACVGAQSSGFLKSQISPAVLSVLQQKQEQDLTQQQDAAASAPESHLLTTSYAHESKNAREDYYLQKAYGKMQAFHVLQQKRLKIKLDAYDKITMDAFEKRRAERRIAITRSREELSLEIAEQKRIAKETMHLRQRQEKMAFINRMQCCQAVPGDQSRTPNAEVQACMKNKVLLEKAPVADYHGLTQNEKAAVQKQSDRFQQIQEHAMNDTLEGLFSMEHEYEQKQLDDIWQKIDKELLDLGLTTGTEMTVEKADSQKADVEKRSTIVSEFQAALADAKKVMAEAKKKKDDA